ncbi:hypothetical protein WR25_09209 [Diploscapter pachys]|uniref:Histidine acid phosphatase n=1 Tax=Diploscapter pachys TaxID=2018661 RepID=A0A2A2LYE7_9BILA|nr:hypothetical protein WR25_09209 [Diploscapter pachys]
MHLYYLIFIIAFQYYFLNINADELVQVNLLFRHGIRTPLECYPDDPYLSYWNQWPKGELLPDGMAQAITIGLALKGRYIDTLKFMSPNYKRWDIYMQACGMPRCLQTASSLFAGFYSKSEGTYPKNFTIWPGNWSPVPIHSAPLTEDKLLQVDYSCPRDLEIYAERASNPKYLEWLLISHGVLLEKVYMNTGVKITDARGALNFFDCIKLEHDSFNFTLPSWLNQKTFDEAMQVREMTFEYVYGGPGFGEPASHEMNRLRAGNLLETWIGNMQLMMNSSNETYKMVAYGAHDTTIVPLLRIFDVKERLLGTGNPDFTSMVTLELWKKNDGSYVVKTFYYPNSKMGSINFTSMISGCPPIDECPFDIFVNRKTRKL